MPVENLDPVLEQPADDWQQLAHNARENWDLEHPGVAALYEEHVVPQLHGRGLGHLAVSSEDKAGGRFLHKHGDIDAKEVDQVVGYLRSNGATVTNKTGEAIPIPDKAGDRTAAYLKFMSEVVQDGVLTGDPESVEWQVEAHVIRAENVPESHFALQQRIARERGRGDMEVTPGMRRRLIEAAQADQRSGLKKWVEYLGSEDGNYPDWFKRYAWDSVVKLGAYDEDEAKFARRDDSTVAPYPELNREALAYTYDTLKKFHVLGKKVEDDQLRQIVKEGSFGRLYAHAKAESPPIDPELLKKSRWFVAALRADD